MLKFTERTENGTFGNIITLENGVELFPNEWNGEEYIVKENGEDRCFKPVQEPDVVDDNGEVLQWKTIGFEEV